MRVQFFKLNPSVRVSNRDSEPLGSSYKLEPTEALYLPKLLQKILPIFLSIYNEKMDRVRLLSQKSAVQGV